MIDAQQEEIQDEYVQTNAPTNEKRSDQKQHASRLHQTTYRVVIGHDDCSEEYETEFCLQITSGKYFLTLLPVLQSELSKLDKRGN